MKGRVVVALTAVCLLAACGGGGGAEQATGPGPESRVVRGPVSMTVRTDREDVVVGEKLTLEIDVIAAAGVEIVMPEIDETIGPFAVRETSTPPDVPEGTSRRWRHRFVLDTFTAGDAEIPPLALQFTDARRETIADGSEPIEGTIESEPLSVAVGTVLSGDAEEKARDIRPELEVDAFAPFQEQQARERWTLAAIIGGGVLVALALGALIIWRRTRPAAPAPPVPADVWARAEFERLVADRLAEKQQFEAFYVRLSGIVREYIERRFGLMAPERTTDEFLAEARRSDALRDEHKTLLATFLRAADMVKFARHLPSVSECEEALASARGFVEQTRPAATAPGAPATERAA